MNSNNDALIENIKANLYEIYIDIKNSLSKTELEKLTNGTNKSNDSSIDLPILMNNLKTYINFILHEKNPETENFNYDNKDTHIEVINQLESYIRKLEDNIKFLIKTLFQNKIFRDSLESKLRAYLKIEEDYENLKEKVRYEDGKFMENDRKDNEINILRRENSNLKKEISKIKQKYQKIILLEEKNRGLEKLHLNDEENIKNLNLKINQLNSKIVQMEEEISNSKKSFRETDKMHYLNNEIYIGDNNYKKINFYSTKISLDKFNTKSSSNNSKKTNIQKASFNFFHNESRNNKSRTTKTMNSYKSLLKSNTYNEKEYTSKNPSTQIRNDFYKSVKKNKNNSVSMRAEEKETSEILKKYLKSHDKNNFTRNGKIQGLKKLEPNFSGYKFHISNNSVRRKISREEKNNKNIIYEHSALNIFGINGKYKI